MIWPGNANMRPSCGHLIESFKDSLRRESKEWNSLLRSLFIRSAPRQMNTPRLWFIPNSFPERLTPDYHYDASPDRLMFIDGQPLKTCDGIPSFRVAASRSQLLNYDVVPNSIAVPLV